MDYFYDGREFYVYQSEKKQKNSHLPYSYNMVHDKSWIGVDAVWNALLETPKVLFV